MREDRLARMSLQALMADVGWTLWAGDPDQDLHDRVRLPGDGPIERWERATTIFESAEFPRWIDQAAGG